MKYYDRPRRSWLISTAENERFLQKQRDSAADAVILELEAGTFDKDQARELAARALRDYDYGNKYSVLRVNPILDGEGKLDLEAALGSRPDAIMLTKVKTRLEVVEIDAILGEYESQAGVPVGSTDIVMMMETAECIFDVPGIARASSRVRALCFGPGDYTEDIKGRPTLGTAYPAFPGLEILVPRSLVVAGCRAAGVSPIDGPALGSVLDTATMLVHGWQSRALGFDGMIALSPTQIGSIHQAFDPLPNEVARARHAVEEYEASIRNGKGVVGTNDAEMVSLTTANQYRDILRRAGHA